MMTTPWAPTSQPCGIVLGGAVRLVTRTCAGVRLVALPGGPGGPI